MANPAVATSPSLLLFLVLLSLHGLCLSAPHRCHPNDKRALFQIKTSLNNASEFDSWKPNTDCCEWDMVQCDPNTNRINKLSIVSQSSSISGHIPPAIGDLPYLERLSFLNHSNLTGPIPPEITKLACLKLLSLDSNSLSGPVPPCLVKLKSLIYLSLSNNKLTGTIPPEFSQFHNLESLILERNKLTGPIPESFGRKVVHLFLSHNRLTGPLPKSFGKLNFKILSLSDNLLTGDVTHVFGAKKALWYVDLSRNAFKFDLTKVVFPKNLTWLILEHNKIYGSLPASLNGLHLRYIDVSYNQLCGKIPTGGKLQGFQQSQYFHNRCLCGAPLPAC